MVQMQGNCCDYAVFPANCGMFEGFFPLKKETYTNLREERQDFLRFSIGQNKQIIRFARKAGKEKIRLEGGLDIS